MSDKEQNVPSDDLPEEEEEAPSMLGGVECDGCGELFDEENLQECNGCLRSICATCRTDTHVC